jgi:hypothetical protein
MARVILKNRKEILCQLKGVLQQMRKDREELEEEWQLCQDVYQGIPQQYNQDQIAEYQLESMDSGEGGNTDYAIMSTIGTQAQQFLQSKLCVSEPVVTVSPTTRDHADKMSAEAIRSYIKYMRHHTDMQERLEGGVYHHVATIGIGVFYTGWDPNAGEPNVEEGFDPRVNPEFEMTGGLCFKAIAPHDFWIDPNVNEFYDARCCVHRDTVPMEVAIARFPKKLDLLKKYSKVSRREHLSSFKNAGNNGEYSDGSSENAEGDIDYSKVVPIYYYWEKATPENGMLGRLIPFLDFDDPKPLMDDVDEENGTDAVETAYLPYDDGKLPFEVLTDLDVSGTPYGLSRTVLVYPIIQALSQFYTIILANIDLHGSLHLLLPEGSATIPSDSPVKTYYFNPHHGAAKPSYLNPSSVTGDIWRMSEIFTTEIQNVFGMNEMSQGQINRELASYAVQLSIETDDKYRVRLFNKKKKVIVGIYNKGISRARQFMNDSHNVSILGLEKYSALSYFKASDISLNYRVDVDYGNYLPPDPTAKKNQLMELLKTGIIEKAGMDPKRFISVLVDGDMLDVKDLAEGARLVQEEEITRMMRGEEVEVTNYHIHEDHLASLAEYMNSIEFEVLPLALKQAVLEHKQQHVKKLAELQAKAQPPPQGGPQGGPPQGGPQGAPPPGM